MRKLIGSVSLFTAMIFLLVVSVITATIQSARVQGAKVMACTVLSMGLDSLFANYDVELFSEFGVLLLKGSDKGNKVDKDMLSGLIQEYMNYNIDVNKDLYFADNTDLYGIEIQGVSIEDYVRATDGGGLIWQDMVVDYEKYAKVINLAAEYLGVEEQTQEAKEVDSICVGMNAVSEKIMVVNEKARAMIEKIDGIVCDEDGVDLETPKQVAYFFKRFCPFDKTMEGLNISNQNVVNAVKNSVQNPLTFIDSAISLNNKNKRCSAEVSKIYKLTNSALKYLDEATVLMVDVEESQTAIDNEIQNLDVLINSNYEVIQDETMKGIMEQYDAVCAYNEILVRDICDVELMGKSLRKNKEILEEISNICNSINYDDNNEKIGAQLEDIRELIQKVTFDGICFEYENLQQSGSNTDVLEEIQEFLEIGFMSLIVPDGTTVSKREVAQENLASSVCDMKKASEIQKEGDLNTTLAKRIIYTEYVMDKFVSFTDKKEGAALNYEVEYILYGGDNDVDNLTAAVFSIATIRSGTNMIYLITDSDKRNAAYNVAFNLVGTAKYEPVIRVVQFALMYLWAYAEALMDVKILLEGKEIVYTKNDETWQLSIENLMSMNLDGEAKEQRGIDYENFLRLLLYLADDGKKSAYTMDLVELWMIKNGREDFRLKYYLYGMEVEMAYSAAGKYSYTEKAAYTY